MAEPAAGRTARLVVVATSPRTPPGLLSWPAWEALRAGPVLVGDAGHPQLPHLVAAGVHPVVLPRPEGGDAALAAAGEQAARERATIGPPARESGPPARDFETPARDFETPAGRGVETVAGREQVAAAAGLGGHRAAA